MAPSAQYSVDDVAGGQTAIEHLLSIGRKNIAFVGGALDVPQVRDSLAGARLALQDRPGTSLRVFETRATTVLEGRRVGKEINALPASERPDAVFAANDLVAIGFIQGLLRTRRLSIPDDIDFSASAIAPLTSIRQPSRLMGETALEMLEAEAADPNISPRAVEFQPELVVRTSA